MINDKKLIARHSMRYILRFANSFRSMLIFFVLFILVYISINHLSKASLYGVLNIFTVDFNDENLVGNINQTNQTHFYLENFSHYENELLTNRLNIFFVQTSENDNILFRHGCSIESAARLHPTSRIFVLMRSQTIHRQKGSFTRLLTYTNIRFIHFNEHEIYANTNLMHLNRTQHRQFIRYFAISHLSDFVRTALLYKYGGIYFDLDVIPLRDFRSFSNTVALESHDGVNVAVLAFEKQHLALDIQMDIQLELVKNSFNAFCWNCVGPAALSQALKRLCDNKILYMHAKDKCHQIDIQPSFVFYPIEYQEIPQFFRPTKSFSDIEYLIRNSSIYSIHYFHHMTMNLPIENHSPFARIAQIYCPKIYEKLIDQTDIHLRRSLSSKRKTFLFCFIVSLLSIFIFFVTSVYLHPSHRQRKIIV